MTLVTINDVVKATSPPQPGTLSPLQAQNIVLRLLILATEPCDPLVLKILARYFTPTDYEDLVEERTVISKCGYPACSNNLTDIHGKARNPQNATVVHWQHSFCHIICYQSSQFYKEQLSAEPLTTRKNVCSTPPGEMHYEQSIMLLPDIREMAAKTNQTVSQTVAEEIGAHKHLLTSLESLELDTLPSKPIIERHD